MVSVRTQWDKLIECLKSVINGKLNEYASMSFKSINTRGFATVANSFMQLVDGMDNSSPLLNFVLGNLIGVSEIDVQSVELLPGSIFCFIWCYIVECVHDK
jgi:hypothetical protein